MILNLVSFAKNIKTDLMIGNVRSATLSENIGYQNSHPFTFENLLFSHNGYIENFEKNVRSKLLNLIDNKYFHILKGNTDSELIFLLLITIYKKSKNLINSILETLEIIFESSKAAMLNFIIAEYKNKQIKLYATRTALKKKIKAPSLYYQINKNKNIYIASERLDNKKWISVKNNSLIECTKDKLKILEIK